MTELSNKSIELRQNLGLSDNASTNEVFDKLRQQHNLPPDSTHEDVIRTMFYDALDDMQDINNQLNQIKSQEQPNNLNPSKLIGKIAMLFSTKK